MSTEGIFEDFKQYVKFSRQNSKEKKEFWGFQDIKVAYNNV